MAGRCGRISTFGVDASDRNRLVGVDMLEWPLPDNGKAG